MFSCYAFAPCERSVGDELNPYLTELTPIQLRRRIRQSWVFLKSKLSDFPTIEKTIEHPEQAAVTIFSTHNITADLMKCGLHVIDFGEPRKSSTGVRQYFYIRATLSASPSNANKIGPTLNEAQARIYRIIQKEFGGDVGPNPDPYTYLIPTDSDVSWPQGTDHKNIALAQLWKIEAVLAQNGLSAELGLKYIPKTDKNLLVRSIKN